MNCEQAAEFISRLCDGQVIPPEAAGHIGVCESCHAQLNAYLAMGAELRRLASLEQPESLKAGTWETRPTPRISWWQKGSKTMRVPRYAFAALLAVILLLSGGLVLVRAQGGGPTLLLHSTLLSDGKTGDCWLTTDDNPKTNQCGFALEPERGGMVGVMFRFVSKDGDRTQLAVKVNYKEHGRSIHFIDDFKDVPERMLFVDPDGQQQIEVPGLGGFQLTAAYLQHPPSPWGRPDESIVPRKDEFRVVGPVLIRGDEVICDLSNNGDSIDDGDSDATLMIYYPGEGRYLVSRVPFEGAVEGTVQNGHIRFTLEGQNYLLLGALPIISAEHVWVSHDPSYKISDHVQDMPDDRPMFRVRSLRILLQDKMNKHLD